MPKFKKQFDLVKVDEDERIVGGIVYAPDTVDAQGDWTDATEIRKMMYLFMEEVQSFDLMHEGTERDITILESFQPEVDTLKGGKTVPAGSWFLTTRVNDDAIWQGINDGDITGYSIEGSAMGEESGP